VHPNRRRRQSRNSSSGHGASLDGPRLLLDVIVLGDEDLLEWKSRRPPVLGTLSGVRMSEICAALAVSTDCG